jgi:hypothetical protein
MGMKYSSGPQVPTMPKDGPNSVEVRSRAGDARQFFPSAARNCGPIREVLTPLHALMLAREAESGSLGSQTSPGSGATEGLANVRAPVAIAAFAVLTMCLLGRCLLVELTSNAFENIGGRSRTRTYDPLIKSQLLYHLSYAPADRRARQKRPASWDRPLPEAGALCLWTRTSWPEPCSEESPASRST